MRFLFIVLIVVVCYRTAIEQAIFQIRLVPNIYKSLLALRKIGTLILVALLMCALSLVLR